MGEHPPAIRLETTGGHLEMRQRQVAPVTAPEERSLPTLQYLCKPMWLVVGMQLSTSAAECRLRERSDGVCLAMSLSRAPAGDFILWLLFSL